MFQSRVKSDDGRNIVRLANFKKELSENVLRYHVSHPKDLNDLLLPAYCSALLAPDCSDEDMAQGLQFLPDITADAIAYESADVLVRILQCAVALPAPRSEPLMKELWPYMCLAQDLPPAGQQCLQKLLARASQEQMSEIVEALLEYELVIIIYLLINLSTSLYRLSHLQIKTLYVQMTVSFVGFY